MKPAKETPFQITFGTKEGEIKGEHDSFSAQLSLSNGAAGPVAQIIFEIDTGRTAGQFDYDRSRELHDLTLEDAEKLQGKLKKFIKEGKKFLKKYEMK